MTPPPPQPLVFDGDGDYECLYTPNSIVRAQNRARVTVIVNDTGRAKARPVSLHANSGAKIICCPASPTKPTCHIDYLHVLCEGFGSSVDLCNRFVVRNAIVQQSGLTSQVRNFIATERVYVQAEMPSNIDTIRVTPSTCERIDIGTADRVDTRKDGASAVLAFDPSKLQTRGRCVICTENCANCIFYPCKCICVCSMCYVINRCPMCRSDITSHSVVYIA